jgi:broad specificity phosphatase PhoE
MITPKLLLPLRIPELGPALGKLVAGTGRRPGGLSLETARVQLVTTIIEAAGDARRLAGQENRSAAAAALGRDVWLAAWDGAVRAIGDLVMARARQRLAAEAARVRLPRRRRRLALGEAERRAATARLGSAGARLVPALDRLEEVSAGALEATPAEREALEAWQEALKAAARRLEEAWLALEDAVEREAAHWDRVVEAVAAWRRPVWPVVVVTLAALAVAVWLGLILGGFVLAPPWLLPWLHRLPAL